MGGLYRHLGVQEGVFIAHHTGGGQRSIGHLLALKAVIATVMALVVPEDHSTFGLTRGTGGSGHVAGNT